MTNVWKRPVSAAALLCAVLWIGLVVYEDAVKRSSFFASVGFFGKLLQVVQVSALGVVGFAALAFLAERVWPPRP
jgi:hypothetical protein